MPERVKGVPAVAKDMPAVMLITGTNGVTFTPNAAVVKSTTILPFAKVPPTSSVSPVAPVS